MTDDKDPEGPTDSERLTTPQDEVAGEADDSASHHAAGSRFPAAAALTFDDLTAAWRDLLRTDTATVLSPREGGGFDIKQFNAERRAEETKRRDEQAALDRDHQRTEERKRNDQRLLHERVMFYAVVSVLSVVLVIALIAALVAKNNETKEWGRSIVVLIVGGS